MKTQQLHEDQEVVVFYPDSDSPKKGVFCGFSSHGCVVLFDDDSADTVPRRWVKDRQAGLFSVSTLGCDN
jgi:hypothetical protein